MLAPAGFMKVISPALADGAHALAEAARDHREVVLLSLDLRVEVGVGKGDRPDRRQRVEHGPIGVVEGFGPAATGDGQPEPAVGELDRRRQVLSFPSGGSADSDTAGERSNDPAEESTAARVSSPPMERFTSSVASKRPRSTRAVIAGVEVALGEIPEEEERQHRERQECGLGGEEQCRGEGNADARPRDDHLALDASKHSVAPRAAKGGLERSRGTCVHHQVADGPDQCRADLAIPARQLFTMEHEEGEGGDPGRGHHPADVEGGGDQRLAPDGLGHDRRHREGDHRQGGRQEEDEQDEESLVEIERVGLAVDEDHERPNPAGCHERAEHHGEDGRGRARPAGDAERAGPQRPAPPCP